MAGWQVVAQGTNIWNLSSTVGEMHLPHGSEIAVIMDLKLPIGSLFNTGAADWLAEKFVPDGLEFVDAYGSGSQGTIKFKADPAWLLAVLAFISAHWLALTVAGVLLTAVIISIIVMVKIAVAPPALTTSLVIGGGLALVGILLAVSSHRGTSVKEMLIGKT